VKIEIQQTAYQDLADGTDFYDGLEVGLGSYFLDCLFSDISALLLNTGIHPVTSSYYRALSNKFPFAIYYSVDSQTIRVSAVLDCRRKPAWIRKRLRRDL
jgi:hypothetical protein